MALLEEVHGVAIQRAMVPYVPYVLRYRLKMLFSMEIMAALPALVCSEAARMPRAGFQVRQGRQGAVAMRSRQAAGGADAGADQPGALGEQYRQATPAGPGAGVQWGDSCLGQGGLFCPAGDKDGQWHRCGDHGTLSGLWAGDPKGPPRRQAGTRARDLGDGLVLESLAPERGPYEEASRRSKSGRFRRMRTPWSPALVIQARANRVGHARLHKGVVDRGFLDSTDRWWLDQQGLGFVVPAKTTDPTTDL
jgi:hypothetical protein